MRLVSTRYYGYFDSSFDNAQDLCYHVLCIAPPRARLADYIGSKDVKFSELLCLDDFILNSLPIRVDWSKVRKY